MKKIVFNSDVIRILLIILFSLLFVSIPWEDFFKDARGVNFVDRDVYEGYFLSGKNAVSIDYFDGIIDYFTNEPSWHYGVLWILDNSALSTDNIFLAISFATIFSFSLLLQRWSGIYSLLFLFNPLVIDLAFSQLRLALATSMLVCAYLLRNRWRTFALAVALLSITVHTAAILFLLIYFAVWLTGIALDRRRMSELQILIILICMGFLVAFVTGPAREILLSSIGDRRADYSDMTFNFKSMLFWFGLFGAYVVFGYRVLSLDYGRYAIVILSILCWIYFLGGYSSRFAAFGFPCLIAGMLDLKQPWRILIVVIFVVYSAMMWLYWLGIY